MSNRNLKRQRQRQEEKGYKQLFSELAPRDQRTINEKVIGAVDELTNLDGHGAVGSKTLIENRAKNLILDTGKVGFTLASKRYRNAILRQKKVAEKTALKNGKCHAGYPYIGARHFVPKKPLISMAQNAVLAGLEPAYTGLEAV